MDLINYTNHDELSKKYPLGYVLFPTDYTKEVIQYDSPVSQRFSIAWDSAKIISIDDKNISLILPNMEYKTVRIIDVHFVLCLCLNFFYLSGIR